MLFKNLKTGNLIEASNPESIAIMQGSPNYVTVVKTAPNYVTVVKTAPTLEVEKPVKKSTRAKK